MMCDSKILAIARFVDRRMRSFGRWRLLPEFRRQAERAMTECTGKFAFRSKRLPISPVKHAEAIVRRPSPVALMQVMVISSTHTVSDFQVDAKP